MNENTKILTSWALNYSETPYRYGFSKWAVEYRQILGYYSLSREIDHYVLLDRQSGNFNISNLVQTISDNSKQSQILLENTPQGEKILYRLLEKKPESEIYLFDRPPSIEAAMIEFAPMFEAKLQIGDFKEEPDLIYDFSGTNLIDLITSDDETLFPCTESALLLAAFYSYESAHA
jgi:hypothetical protein